MIARPRSSYGLIQWDESHAVTKSSASGQSNAKLLIVPGEWHPSGRLAELCGNNVYLPMRMLVTADGARTFLVRGSLEETAHVTTPIGQSILTDTYDCSQHVDFSYRRMYLIWRYVRGLEFQNERGMAAHLNRNFTHSRDLYIRPTGRCTPDTWDVLPDRVGLNHLGKNKRGRIKELRRLGREAAIRAGHSILADELAIPFGLYEAAKLDPLNLPDADVVSLVRRALFDIDRCSGEPEEELSGYVEERLLRAIDRHKNDPPDVFNRWLYSSSSSIVKQLAGQKKAPGGQLHQDDVTRCLQWLGWRAYRYVGDCVHECMRYVKLALPEDLSDHERRVFELVYERQPCFGDLPLAMLYERLSFLRPVLIKFWTTFDPEEIPILHRMLDYYGDMAPTRRPADREFKRRKQQDDKIAPPYRSKNPAHRPVCVGPTRSTSTIEKCQSSGIRSSEAFSDVAEHFRELHRVTCPRGCTEWEADVETSSKSEIVFKFYCGCNGWKLAIPTRDVARIVKEFRGDDEK